MCSYCGCDSIEVIGRFMAEHVEIINATGELRAADREELPAGGLALDRLVVEEAHEEVAARPEPGDVHLERASLRLPPRGNVALGGEPVGAVG